MKQTGKHKMARWTWDDKDRAKGNPPDSLYKYYSQSGIEKVVSTNTIKWELPCDENDPFEALGNGWDESAIGRELVNPTPDDTIHLDASFKSKQIQDRISQIVAYVSFSERGNNLLMWTHYAENHSGACIEFDTTLLEKRIDCFSRVNYAKAENERRERVPLQPDDYAPEAQSRIRRFLSKKANEWAYEEEWRWIVPPMASCIKPRFVEDKLLLVSDIPVGAIKRIVFGCKMPISKRIALAKLVREKHKTCTFSEVVPDKERYLLSIESLDIALVEQTETRPAVVCEPEVTLHSK